MKHLRKYESSEYSNILNFITDCFVELEDQGILDKLISDGVIRYEYTSFDVPNDLYKLKNISKYIKNLDKTKEVMCEIEVAINRILSEFPKIDYFIEYDDGVYQGEIYDIPKIMIVFRNLPTQSTNIDRIY